MQLNAGTHFIINSRMLQWASLSPKWNMTDRMFGSFTGVGKEAGQGAMS